MAGRQKSDEKRDEILAAAEQEFARRDFHEVLMDDVAARAGVGKGTLYRYFPTKDELFLATVLRGLDQSHGEFQQVFAEDAPLETILENAVARMLAYFSGRAPLLTLLQRYEDRLSNADTAAWQRRRVEAVAAIVGALERAEHTEKIRRVDAEIAAEMLLGMVHGGAVPAQGDEAREDGARDRRTLPERRAPAGTGDAARWSARGTTSARMRPAPRSPLVLASLLVLVACSCGKADQRAPGPTGAGPAAETGAAPGAGASGAITVTIEPVAVQRVERTVDFVGTLRADAEAEVATEVDGRLLEIVADLGDQVTEGQVLAALDSASLDAQLREATANLQKTTNEEARARRLKQEGVMSQQEFDTISSAQSVALARRDVLAIQLGHTKIRAPFAGRIAKRLVDVGNYVRVGTPIFVLVADDPLRLRGEVPERFVAQLAVGQDVRGFVEAYPDETLAGRLARISAAADPTSRALTVEALIPNPDGRLKVGFFCKAAILTKVDSEALVIPSEALVNFAGVTRVFVIDENDTARSREVRTGLGLGTRVEVLSGLERADRVATSALGRLTDGARVVVRSAGPAATGAATGAAAAPAEERS